jgi:NADPH2:quinone reductase
VTAKLPVQAVRFGAPRVLIAGPVPDPEPGPGQVVVRTAAADVLFVDTAIRAGHATDFFPARPSAGPPAPLTRPPLGRPYLIC